jgi:hypothetical protein
MARQEEGEKMTARDRYENDPQFRMLVDLIHSWIRECKYTPTEVREAAMLAAIQYDSYTIRNTVFLDDSR